ncbi:hypothetical protein LAY57_07055 [Argonema antarcticum A004/B2]|nr:hypothetical protein [Argonema antarcticum A004/B2]
MKKRVRSHIIFSGFMVVRKLKPVYESVSGYPTATGTLNYSVLIHKPELYSFLPVKNFKLSYPLTESGGF